MSVFFLYQRKRKGKISPYWYGKYAVNRGDVPKTVSLGLTDKVAALAKLQKMFVDAQRESVGLLPLGEERISAKTPLTGLVDLYSADLVAMGRGEQYAADTSARLRRLITECKWQWLRDVRPASFVTWRGTFSGSPKTQKEYQASIHAFMNWCVKTEKAGSNPMSKLGKPRTGVRQQVRPSRALSLDEIRRLIAVAAPDHRLAYLAMIYTGQRCQELASLVWGDVRTGAGENI
ncbi:MAG: hypothetical protein LBK99_01495, partial [Opitutaceae bacterium]|nr:hypothetical protein [Opitutaceae bacterium]